MAEQHVCPYAGFQLGFVWDFTSSSAPFPMLSTLWRCAGGDALCGTGESTSVWARAWGNAFIHGSRGCWSLL